MSAEPEGLQFDRAERGSGAPASAVCGACKRAIERQYYAVGNQVVCERCRQAIEASRTEGSELGRFLRATVFGSVAAAVGAGIYFGIAALTGYEFGLVAIIVGLLVGAAVRNGSRGRGGWVYQTLAIVLTYTAIVTTYVPHIVGSFKALAHAQMHSSPELAATQAPGARGSSSQGLQREESHVTQPVEVRDRQAQTADPSAGEQKSGWSQRLFAWAVVLAIAFAAPFLGGLRNVMGLIIIGIGLYQAWKMNRYLPLTLTGPFTLGASPPTSSS